jgi:hypothetical protein
MGAPFKYAFVLALGLAFGFCIHAPPNLEEIARLARLDQINVLINSAVVRLKPQAAVFAVDPASAERVAEDLDYRIAERIGSVAGWQSFLAVHGSGVHAKTATGEVERLLLSEQASAQTTAKVSNEASLGTKAASDPVRPSPAFVRDRSCGSHPRERGRQLRPRNACERRRSSVWRVLRREGRGRGRATRLAFLGGANSNPCARRKLQA